MPPLGVELAQLRARFQELPPAPPQLIGSSADNRLFSQHAREIIGVARPVAGFDPARGIEDETTKACGFDGRTGTRKRFLAPLLEVFREHSHSRSVGFSVCDRLNNPTDEDM